jgi:hypothetical protein
MTRGEHKTDKVRPWRFLVLFLNLSRPKLSQYVKSGNKCFLLHISSNTLFIIIMPMKNYNFWRWRAIANSVVVDLVAVRSKT